MPVDEFVMCSPVTADNALTMRCTTIDVPPSTVAAMEEGRLVITLAPAAPGAQLALTAVRVPQVDP